MIVTVVGEVDSGKTTFVNTFLRKKIIQCYGRTEALKEYKGSIGSIKVSFLDCPGHDLFSYNNHFALCVSDLIVLLVNATKVNVNKELLQAIVELKKPLVVVFNKFERKYNNNSENCFSLKEILLKKSYCNREFQKDMYDLCSQIPCLNLKPFTQLQYESYSGCYAYFLSLKTKWGLNQFINFFKKVICKVVQPKKRAILYKIADKNSYCLINPVGLNKTFFRGEKTDVLVFKEYFNYNAITDLYSFKEKYAYIEKEQVYIVVEQEKLLQDEGASLYVSLEEIGKKLENLSTQGLFEAFDSRIGTIFFHIEDSQKISIVEKILKRKNIEGVFLKDISLKQFLDLKEEGFKIAISNKYKLIDLRHKTIVLDSLFEVEKHLKQYFQQILLKEEQDCAQRLSQITLIQLDPAYIYKETLKEIVIGLKVYRGTLKKKMVLKSLNLDKVEVLQIQKNNKAIYAHSDPEEYVAAKLKLMKPLNLQKSRWFYNDSYEEIRDKEGKSKMQIQKLEEIERLLKS